MSDYAPTVLDDELPLFSNTPTTPKAKPESEQTKQLKRVTGRIASVIQLFFDSHQVGEEFYAADLHSFVQSHAQVAPGSADRVMRSMKKAEQINYELVNRAKSLYRKVA